MPDHPFREPSPPPKEVSEADEMIRRANAKRKKGWPFIVGVALFLAVPFLYIGITYFRVLRANDPYRDDPLLTAQERSEMSVSLDQAEAILAKREAEYRDATTPDRLASAVPGEGRCDVRRPSSSFDLARPGKPVPRASPIESARFELERLRASLNDKSARNGQYQTARRMAGNESFAGAVNVVLVASAIVDATMMLDPETRRPGFVPGHVVGRAYLYSFDKHAIVCAADIDARSSESITVEYRSTALSPTLEDPATFLERTKATQEKLREDLMEQTRLAVDRSMRGL